MSSPSELNTHTTIQVKRQSGRHVRYLSSYLIDIHRSLLQKFANLMGSIIIVYSLTDMFGDVLETCFSMESNKTTLGFFVNTCIRPSILVFQSQSFSWFWQRMSVGLFEQWAHCVYHYELAPIYLKELLTPCKPPGSPRFSNKLLLSVPRCSLSSYGDRAFSFLAPTLYNTIQYNTIQYNTIQYNTIQYNTTRCNAMQYNTTQCNAIHYNTIQ